MQPLKHNEKINVLLGLLDKWPVIFLTNGQNESDFHVAHSFNGKDQNGIVSKGCI